jgi:HK97 family phage portal protein
MAGCNQIEDVMDKIIDINTRQNLEIQTVKSLGFNDLTRDEMDSGLWDSEVKAFMEAHTLKGLFFNEDWPFITLDLVSDYVSRSPMVVVKTKTEANGKESEEIIKSHPVLTILEQPNEFQEYSQFIYLYCVELDLMGNTIVFYASAKKELRIIPAETVVLDFNIKGEFSGYIVETDVANPFQPQADSQMFFPKEKIWHQRRPNPKSLLWGLSPFVANRKSILFNRYTQDWLNSFYLKGATGTVVLTMEKAVDEKSALRFLRSFEMAYTGRRNQRRPMVLPKGVSVSPLSMPIAEQGLPELVKMNRENILNILRVPKHAVSLAESGSLGSEEHKQALKFFYESAIIPKQIKIQAHLTRKFRGVGLLEEDESLAFDNSDVEILREDMVKKADLAVKLNGIYTTNEIRELFDKEPKEGGDTLQQKPEFSPQQFSFLEYPRGQESKTANQEAGVLQIEDKALDDDDLLPQRKDYRESVVKALINKHSEHMKFRAKQNLEIIETVDEKVKKFWEETFKEWSELAVKIAAKELRKSPARQKAKDDEVPLKVPSKRRLRKLLDNALDESSEKHLDFFIDSFNEVVSESYDVQTSIVTEGENKESIEALKAKNEKGRRVLLEARGLSTFARIRKTQTDAIMDVVEKGVADKIPLRDIGTKISDRFSNITQGKAETIARTEALTAVSIGKQAALKDAVKILGKENIVKVWINLGDLRVRGNPAGPYADAQFDHWELQGETKEVDEPFSNGLDYPRDVNGEAGNVINCRCDFLMVPREDLESLQP